jgi:hypothetical protein
VTKTVPEYLARDAEPEAALADSIDEKFGHALEIPAYAENESLLEALRSVPAGPMGPVLLVVVVNARADSPPEVHEANRAALEEVGRVFAPSRTISTDPPAHLFDHPYGRLLVIDRSAPGRFLPAGQGIGLARKIGCDLVLRLRAAGRIASPWIHATDADTILPGDYFEQMAGVGADRTAAAIYFFEHRFSEEESLARAGRLYEISLRYQTLGLAWAGSPYAYQSMGSCLAIGASAYARVRGFPKKKEIEDFTILNDLAKIGAIERLAGSPIRLAGRISTRVPTSTGQALSVLVGKRGMEKSFRLHHPLVYAHLAAWIRVLGGIARRGPDLAAPLSALPRENPFFRADLLEEALNDTGAFAAVRGAIREPGDEITVLRRLHSSFDAFSTRELLDALRDGGIASLPYREALAEAPFAGLADSTEEDLEELRALLAQEERLLSTAPAGVPSLEPEQA